MEFNMCSAEYLQDAVPLNISTTYLCSLMATEQIDISETFLLKLEVFMEGNTWPNVS